MFVSLIDMYLALKFVNRSDIDSCDANRSHISGSDVARSHNSGSDVAMCNSGCDAGRCDAGRWGVEKCDVRKPVVF